jgi:hypothetical protein
MKKKKCLYKITDVSEFLFNVLVFATLVTVNIFLIVVIIDIISNLI